ncbi:MAG: class I lanthipeptide [Saprospiraceae bacterium]
MQKASIKKKLSFKKELVANLNEEEAHAIQGGINTSIWWPCTCPPPPGQTRSKIPCACPSTEPWVCGGDSDWDCSL